MTAEPALAEPARPPIIVLPDDIVDQIAAGEVIERPASVVKELVENSLDAGARHIAIEIEEGGRRLIRVIDDGSGMSPEEARLALRRHATSKLRALADLFGLSTMGFRGEALPSIAAVSRLALTTRTRGALAATHLAVDAGRLLDAAEIGAPIGTQIEVRDLLFNVPARLKFLKGDATESAHVSDVVSKLAMAHPEVHFRLRNHGRAALQAPPHRDGFERAQCLLGARLAGRLHRARGSEGGVDVVAYLAAPELAQTTARGVQLYAGRRAIRDRGLLHALAMGYGELIPRGRYPLAVLFVEVPAGALDVNVHPQKMEVRFADPQRVYAAVRHVVARAIAEAPWLGEAAPGQVGAAPVRMHAIAAAAPPPPRPLVARASEMAADYARQRERMLLPWTPAAAPPPSYERREAAREAEPAPAPTPEPATFFTHLRYLGQLDRTYLVCEAAGELVLLDQHAAHERVAFQRLKERYESRALPGAGGQRLLFPQTVELSPAQAAMAIEAREELCAVGFELEHLSGDDHALKAVPAGLRGAEPAAVLRALCDELCDRGGSRAADERLDAVFATIACHSVVRAGDALSAAEAEALLSALDGVDFKAHCPHGRPVLLRISVSEIARRFGRT